MARRAFIASPELMSEAKKGGITHLGLEIPYSAQPLVDELAKERINKTTYVNILLALADAHIYKPTCTTQENLKRTIEYEADTILNATKNGIKVLAIDTGISKVSYQTKDGKIHFDGLHSPFAAFIKDFIPFAKQSPYFNTNLSTLKSSDFGMIERKDLVLQQYNENQPILEFTLNVVAASEKPNLDFRLQMDYLVAINIAKAIGPSGKMLVNYGAAHTLRQKTDIDGVLNKMNIQTKVIDVHGNINDFQYLAASCKPEDKIGGCEGPYAHDRIFLDPQHKTLEKAGQEPNLPKPIPLTQFNK